MNRKKTLISALFIGILPLLLLISVFNTNIKDTPLVTSVGPMQLSAAENGIALSQGYRGKYYTVSPFNDFYITTDNLRSAFISTEEIEMNSYESQNEKSKLHRIVDTVGTYFDMTSPSQKYKAQAGSVTYTTSTLGNTTTISYSFIPNHPLELEKVGITLSYNADDIVFDSIHNVYSAFSTQDIQNFEKIYDISLAQQSGDLNIHIPGTRMYIYNPKGAYLLTIEAQSDQQVTVNKDTRIIEITQKAEKKEGSYEAQITLKANEARREEL